MLESVVRLHRASSPAEQPIEVVERKGIGHPDTLADALAERLSVAYSRHCRERYGAVLHHNLDKLYLRGGHSRTDPRVFEMTEPTTVMIGGRVSTSFGGEPIDYRGLFEDVVTKYLATVLPNFDVSKWLRIEHVTTDRSRYPTWFHPRDLDDLPEIRYPTGSDTVAVTGWWPHTPTERLVLAVERYLNQEASGPRYTHLGQDIKVMAFRRDRRVDVTLNVAVHPNAAPTADAYETVLRILHPELEKVAAEAAAGAVDPHIRLNTHETNPFQGKRQYLLGSGTCLEFGEEGFVGRGNGPAGFIAVHRPKSVEAAYGKNPVYHSGKVYTIYAEQIARTIHDEHGVGATVTIVAANSNSLRDPNYVAVDLHGEADHADIEALTRRVLAATDHLALIIDDERLVPR